MTERTIRGLSRNFVIPAGTQVVLRSNRPLLDTPDEFKKPGAVGSVIKCPPNNEGNYLIQFTDGRQVEAGFDDLALRRREIDDLLANTPDFTPTILYRCQVGSKAYGLSTESSDDDYRGIYIAPADIHWSLHEVPQQLEFKEGHDEVYFELERFLRLALKANPNILEMLWTPLVLNTSPLGDQLLSIRNAFLSKHLYKTYSGYVLSQFRRMKNSFEKSGTFKRKHAMHLIRLLISGLDALKTGEIRVAIDQHRDFLLSIRNGELTFEQIRKHAFQLDAEFQSAFEITDLPEQPEVETVNAFLVEARRSMVS